MNRRRFLELLTTAAVGSAVAYSFPSIIVPRNLIATPDDAEIEFYRHEILKSTDYFMAPRGLAYLINDRSRSLQGWNTVTYAKLPVTLSPHRCYTAAYGPAIYPSACCSRCYSV